MDQKRIILYVIVAIGLIFIGYQLFFNKTSAPVNVPDGALHWHPQLKIIIKGEEQPIPTGIGVSLGNVIDTNLGMDFGMSPTHTHDDTGTIHLENKNPKAKPETLTLGYFFKVWGKTFSQNCIFEFCNGPDGNVSMTVNGKDNTDFGNYFMKDNDKIVIKYE
ncbi:hypothetical protein HYT84_01725 [Candidatus Micrarchaeota archaeon]|nr:hypothetical protein [Candidatus Micrarchaeota archaeon]